MDQGPQRFPIVGIGASAGGVEALKALFHAMPAPPPAMAFVVVTHLSVGHDSALPEILAGCTAMPVLVAADGQRLEPGQAYVLPTAAVLTIERGRLVLRTQPLDGPREPRPIDVFLASLAQDQGELAVGIVLSGSGNDGTLGLKAIKERGGLTITQGTNGSGPSYPEMPDSAFATGFVDLLLPIAAIPSKLAELADGLLVPDAGDADLPDAAMQATISAILRDRVGQDFAGYKDKTFFRRVQRRVHVLRLPGLAAYVARLRQDPEEAGNLFRDLLIGVTGFLRDPEAFAALAKRVIPVLFADRDPDDMVRVWIPGCATGEEAYSIAILLREWIEAHPGGPRAQIFATDIDEAALAIARAGRYPVPLLSNMEPERVARFFTQAGASLVVSKELRDLCIFSSHSLVRDPPFSRIDLVSCRNLLIYLDSRLQEQVIPLFHYALRPGGFLFLGQSDSIARHSALFLAEDKDHRIYRRREDPAGPGAPLPVPPIPRGARRPWPLPAQGPVPAGGTAALRLATEALVIDQFAPAHVLVNQHGDILFQSTRLGKYLEPAAGPPTRQILSMARRGLRPELRAALRLSVETRRRVDRPRVEVVVDDRTQLIALTVAPLPVRDGSEPCFVVLFSDLGPPLPPEALPGAAPPGSPADSVTEQLERELREAQERLQSSIEEYETATDDLKAANEELVSVNEELQSTNEELETSREELQSVNEEFRTVNFELSAKVDQLDRANADLRNLFDSTQIATVFLDSNLLIRSFTPATTAIFNLLPSDRGRPLTDFASRLDRVDLRQAVRGVLDRREPTECRVTTRDGSTHYVMRVLPYRTTEGTLDGLILTFLDVTQVVEGEVLKTLVDELNHRVRNVLQVVQAVAASTLRRAPSMAEFTRTFGGRIRALARAHELVSAGGWSDVLLADLVVKELEPYAESRDQLVTEGPEIRVPPKTALALGMVLHELATNAAKYGALSTGTGRVTVSWETEGPPTDKQVMLRWRETGGPPIAGAPDRRGFGSELIDRQVRHDLGGTIHQEFTATGLQAVLGFPLGVAWPPKPGEDSVDGGLFFEDWPPAPPAPPAPGATPPEPAG